MLARNICISLLAFVCVLVPGGILFRGSEGALYLVELLAFAVCFTLLHLLDDGRQRRELGGD